MHTQYQRISLRDVTPNRLLGLKEMKKKDVGTVKNK